MAKPLSGKIKFEKDDSEERIVLGSSNSTVYRGTFDGQSVAVKQIWKKPKVERSRESSSTDREIEAQIHLKHENVVKMITAEEDVDFRY